MKRETLYKILVSCKSQLAVKFLLEKNKEIERLNKVINEARRTLGEYKHYSVPTIKQNKENEEIVDTVYFILHDNWVGSDKE